LGEEEKEKAATSSLRKEARRIKRGAKQSIGQKEQTVDLSANEGGSGKHRINRKEEVEGPADSQVTHTHTHRERERERERERLHG